MALTRDEIVQAAIQLLDEAGLEGLSLRRLADRLGVRAPTLYWHVRDKRQLLDLMAEAIIAQVEPEELSRPRHGQPWWEWLAERSQRAFQALIAHRDAALVMAGNRPTDRTLPHLEDILGTLVAVGFPPTEALQSVVSLGTLVMGCALEWQAEAARSADPEAERAAATLLELREQYPNLVAAVSGLLVSNPQAMFEHGVRLMIAGLRARHAELVAGARPG